MKASVWPTATATAIIQSVLDKHAAPSMLIVCSNKEELLQKLLRENNQPRDSLTTDSHEATDPLVVRPSSLLQQPTLRMLATSQTVQVAFCPDVSHLRAYLSVFPARSGASDSSGMLVLLDPLELHRPTSAFSAQGLNRTFALAVEAANRSRMDLVLAESIPLPTANVEGDGESVELSLIPLTDPWDQEISIFNVTTKSFGPGGRGWVGRTVQIRRIAERWCTFEQAPGPIPY
ncbi:hypothetical protein B0A48_05072 [Cryoendolithus antarcticus]|uniref:Uncharacterized protein n=1 Tax=Cryoendolithus antarcticus TaxID=1507870 RepID=A0A1V8TE65_9PEZI|nr:hypothetical protein B0A48_05072 [Cryoendolithus antarcticus]